MLSWIGEGALTGWDPNRKPHPPKAGYKPLEVFNP